MLLGKTLLLLYKVNLQKLKFCLHETKIIKEAKITEQSPAYRGYATTYNVEILNSSNSEIFKDIESAISYNLKMYWMDWKDLNLQQHLF